MNIRLLRTSEADLDFVVSAEQHAENRSFVTEWPREQHLGALTSENLAHLIIESTTEGRRVGYLILAGLADANQSIEFRRILVTEKGKGYGKQALRLVKKLAFEKLKAHRLWLDVKEHNVRARHLYEAEGFVVEGVLRECIKADVGFESLVVMSMLSGEYYGAHQSAERHRTSACLS
jgi:RimJ/RimL family protein N-acetyltransferase